MSLQFRDPTTPDNFGTDTSSLASQGLKVWNCFNCRLRKVRCDRKQPCAACTKNKADCIFPVSGRVPRRSRDAHVKKHTELVGRLRRLEAMVGDLSSQVEQSTGFSQADQGDVVSDPMTSSSGKQSSDSRNTQSQVAGDLSFAPESLLNQCLRHINEDTEMTQISQNVGELDIASNGDIVVGSRFWTVFCKEVEDIFEAVQGSTVINFDRDNSSAKESASDSGRHAGYYNFLLRSVSASSYRSEDLYPLPSQMLFLWHIYVDNIDPFIKVLNVPAMTGIVRDLKGGYDALHPSMRALVLVISLAAIMSLEDEEVQKDFGTEKKYLFTSYRAGTELALEQADFLNKTDMTVVQAITIYLAVLQSTGEAQSVWFLNGTLIRLAVSMNLHCESSDLANTTIVEKEMRKRLWWQICLIDSPSQTSPDSRYKISERMFDTKTPTNVNDSDLTHMMSNARLLADKWTDTTILVLRCEIWKLSQRLQSINQTKPISPTALDESLTLFQQFRTKIEQTYLNHLDPAKPLHTFISTSTYLFIAKVDLILHSTTKPFETPTQPPTSPLDKPFHASVSIITHTHALQHSPEWTPYRWQLFNRNPQWHALHLVLTRLCTTRSWTPICEDAWSVAMKAVEDCADLAVRQDLRYQDLLLVVDAVRKHRAELSRHVDSSGEGDMTAMDVTTATATASCMDRNENWGVDEGIDWDLRGKAMRESSREDPILSMDWRAWNVDSQDLGSSLNFWDLDGF